jgi:hypothetical protein
MTNKYNVAKGSFILQNLPGYIYNIKWPDKIRQDDLWERVEHEPVAGQILMNKWGRIGHIFRKTEAITTRRVLTKNLQDKKRDRRRRDERTRCLLDRSIKISSEQRALAV